MLRQLFSWAGKKIHGVDLEHPDVIRHNIETLRSTIKQIEEEKKIVVVQYDAIREKYVKYIGEDHMQSIEKDPIWEDVSEPKFSRQYINSKESRLLREMATVWKKIYEMDTQVNDRKADIDKCNVKLAQSMSLASAHGQLQYTRFERDKALTEKEDLQRQLERALEDARTNLVR